MDYSKLNEAQARAVRSDSPKILTLAGAGTGKTHVLTHRIARLYEDGVLPSNMLAITFTRAAGSEMQDRIINMIGPQGKELSCSTFHSWCLRIIRRYASRLGYKSNLSVYDEEDVLSIVTHIIEDYNYDAEPKKFIKAMGEYYVHGVMLPPDMRSLFEEFKFVMKRNNAMTFDMILDSMKYLIKYDDVSDYLQSKYTHVFVDEFQDSDKRQLRILELIDFENLFVVGDDFQSIYSFSGADINGILNMAQDPEIEVIKLEENYRSGREITEPANRLIKHNNQTEKVLISPRSSTGEGVVLYRTLDTLEEKQTVKAEIRLLMDEVEPEEIAVLTRTNKQAYEIAEHLKQEDIPVYVKGSNSDIFNTSEAKGIASWLGALLNPADDEAMKKASDYPEASLTWMEKQKVELNQLEKRLSFLESMEDMSVGLIFTMRFRHLQGQFEALDDIKSIQMLPKYINQEYISKGLTNRADRVTEIVAKILEYLNEGNTLEEWLEWYKTRNIDSTLYDVNDGKGCVQVMTLHKSKGLEFDSVFIMGCREKNLPFSKGNLEEERRLFYVGMTRAKNSLYLSYPENIEKYAGSGYMVEAESSRFLEEMRG